MDKKQKTIEELDKLATSNGVILYVRESGDELGVNIFKESNVKRVAAAVGAVLITVMEDEALFKEVSRILSHPERFFPDMQKERTLS